MGDIPPPPSAEDADTPHQELLLVVTTVDLPHHDHTAHDSTSGDDTTVTWVMQDDNKQPPPLPAAAYFLHPDSDVDLPPDEEPPPELHLPRRESEEEAHQSDLLLSDDDSLPPNNDGSQTSQYTLSGNMYRSDEDFSTAFNRTRAFFIVSNMADLFATQMISKMVGNQHSDMDVLERWANASAIINSVYVASSGVQLRFRVHAKLLNSILTSRNRLPVQLNPTELEMLTKYSQQVQQHIEELLPLEASRKQFLRRFLSDPPNYPALAKGMLWKALIRNPQDQELLTWIEQNLDENIRILEQRDVAEFGQHFGISNE